MYFLNHNAHTSPLFRDLNILKLPDKIALENCFFINKYFKKCLSTIFKNCFLILFSYLQYLLVQFRVHCFTFNRQSGDVPMWVGWNSKFGQQEESRQKVWYLKQMN